MWMTSYIRPEDPKKLKLCVRPGYRPCVSSQYQIPARPDSPERREPSVEEFEFAASAVRLRESLSCVDDVLRRSDPSISRRVRLVLGEIIGRSSAPHGADAFGVIRVRLSIQPSNVRVQLAGSPLLTPEDLGAGAKDVQSRIPAWMVDDLADDWGIDLRADEPAMWFRIARR
jgi:hypothetical protein